MANKSKEDSVTKEILDYLKEPRRVTEITQNVNMFSHLTVRKYIRKLVESGVLKVENRVYSRV